MKTFVHISPLKGNRKEIRNLIDYIVGLPQDTCCLRIKARTVLFPSGWPTR